MNELASPAARVAVLIPALNEEEALPSVLRAVPEWVSEIVVVDNGSTDRTVEVARLGGATVVHETERGYGAACLRGLAHLREGPDPPDIVAFVDGDHSDDPTQLSLLVDPIVASDADMVLGVRGGSEDGRTVPLHARLGNRLVLGLARGLFGGVFDDLPPFRAIRWEALERLRMDDRNWGWTLQMQIRAHRAGLRIREVSVDHRRRIAGRSKISGTVSGTVKVGTKMMVTLARERLRSAP